MHPPNIICRPLVRASGAEPVTVPVSVGLTRVSDVKRYLLAQHRLPPSVQDLTLFSQGKKLKSSQLIDELQLRPGEFLTWVPRITRSSDAGGQATATAAAAGARAQAGSTPALALAQQPVNSTQQLSSAGLLPAQGYQASGGFESLSGGHGCPVPRGDHVMRSAPDSPRLDTLLPGYASRPHPSPAKPLRRPHLLQPLPDQVMRAGNEGRPLQRIPQPAALNLCNPPAQPCKASTASTPPGDMQHVPMHPTNVSVLDELLEELQEAEPTLQTAGAPSAGAAAGPEPSRPGLSASGLPRGMVIDLTCDDGTPRADVGAARRPAVEVKAAALSVQLKRGISASSPAPGDQVQGLVAATLQAARAGASTAPGGHQRQPQPAVCPDAARQHEASLSSLPLPPALEGLYQLACVVVNMHRLLMARHVQTTFKVLAAAVKGASGQAGLELQLGHLLLLSQLVPSVVWLKDRTRLEAESDLGNARLDTGHTHHTAAVNDEDASGAPPDDQAPLAEMCHVGAGWDVEDRAGLFRRLAQQGWPSHVADRIASKGKVLQASAAQAAVDVGGAVFLGDEDAVIVEVMDPGHWKPPAVSAVQVETVNSGFCHVAGGSGQSHGALGKNVRDRCCAAIRRALVQVVLHIHQLWATGRLVGQADGGGAGSKAHHAFTLGAVSSGVQQANELGQQQGQQGQGQEEGQVISGPPASALQWDPVKQRAWHPVFTSSCLYGIQLEDVAAILEEQGRPAGSPADQLDMQDDGSGAAVPDQKATQRSRGPNPFSSGAPRVPRLLKRDHACTSSETLDVYQLVEHLKHLGWYQNQVVHVEHVAARPARYALPAQPLSPQVARALQAGGVSQLYYHQATAVDALMSGQNVVVATSTASGKSVCYNVPFMEALAADRHACAIYVFPTKALAQDQLRAVRQLMEAAFGPDAPVVEVYDGDTQQHNRAEARNTAQLLITNPDMLHRSILPFHSMFSRFLSKLSLVVLDEGHAYHGVFGAHTALVLRRLRRLCDQVYNTQPRFCVTSATIANPVQHACRLIGVDHITLVDEDGSPTGPKQFVLWNPPLTNPAAQKQPQTDKKRTSKARSKADQEKQVPRKYRKLLLGDAKEGQQQQGEEDGQDQQQEEEEEEEEGQQEGEVQAGSRTRVSGGKRAERAAARQALKAANAAKRRMTKVSDGLDAWVADAGLSRAVGPLKQQLYGSSPAAPLMPAPASRRHTPAADQAVPTHGQGSIASEALPGQAPQHVSAHVQPSTRQKRLAAEALSALSGVTGISLPSMRVSGGGLPGAGAGAGAGGPGAGAGDVAAGQAHELDVRPCLSLSSGWSLDKARSAGDGPMGVKHKGGSSSKGRGVQGFNAAQAAHTQFVQRGSTGGGGSSQGGAAGGANAARGVASEQHRVAQKMPGRGQWNAKVLYGAAGATEDTRRDSPIVELSLLLAECMQHGLRTIAFCKSRKLAELVGAYTRETLKVTAPHVADRLKVYRGGYSPAERRDIEQGLHSGQILGVAATNALELGVDVGGLDATLHLGFQGSLASLRQQAGRAGRREQASLAVYVAFDGPLDQYFMSHPQQLFDKPLEHTQVNQYNSHVLQQHILCAAFEWPVDVEEAGRDAPYFGPSLRATAQALLDARLLSKHEGFNRTLPPVRYAGPKDIPAADVSLRTIDEAHVDIVLEGSRQVLEQVEMTTAFFQVYDGAIYLYQGRPFLCKKLDLQSRTAIVRPVDVKYYTRVTDYQDIHVTGTSRAYCPRDNGTSHLVHPPRRAHLPPLPTSAAAAAPTPGCTGRQASCSSASGPAVPVPAPAHDLNTIGNGSVAAAGDAGTSLGADPTSQVPPPAPASAVTATCEEAIVTVRFLGYHRVWQGSGQVFDSVNLWLPDVKYETQAAYIRLPRCARKACEEAGLPFREGVHAASHAVLNVLPLLVTCDQKDMGTECDNPYDTRYRPERLILFDKHPGGIGLAAQATPLFHELLVRAVKLVEACPCTLDKGCPACVQHPHCKNYNAVLSKQAGLVVLRACLDPTTQLDVMNEGPT